MKYYWEAYSDDGNYEETSRLFDTQEECYADMMNRVVSKIKRNIDWFNVLFDGAQKTESKGLVTNGAPIEYGLKVNVNEIVLKAHSTCIYKIGVVKGWKPRFKVNDIVRKGTTVAIIDCANEKETNPDNFGYIINIVGHTLPKCNEWPKDDEHWISDEDEKNWSKIGEVTMDVENGEV